MIGSSPYKDISHSSQKSITKEKDKVTRELKEQVALLKKENLRLKTQILQIQQQKDNSKEIQKLREEKLMLSSKIMELESESVLYKKTSDLILDPSINYTIETFSFTLTDKKGKQKIKESLKNKNEEILILKSELMKKEQQISLLQKKKKAPVKQIEKEIFVTQNESNMPLNKQSMVFNKYLFRNKSELDIIKSSHNNFKRKFLGIASKYKPNAMLFKKNKISPNLKKELTNSNNKDIPDFLLTERSQYGKGLDKSENELNITMTNDGDDYNKRIIEKNIYSEIKNLMEEKKNFMLQTMAYENFAFDILASKPNKNQIYNNPSSSTISKKDTGRSTKKSGISSINNSGDLNPSIGFNLTQDIDSMIELIKQRKKFVENEKKNIQKLMKNHCD